MPVKKAKKAKAAAASSDAPTTSTSTPSEPKPLNRAQRRAANGGDGGGEAAGAAQAEAEAGAVVGAAATKKKPFMRKQKRLQSKQDATQPPAADCGLAMEERSKALLTSQRKAKRSAAGTCSCAHACTRDAQGPRRNRVWDTMSLGGDERA